MSNITKPLMLDETGKAIVEALTRQEMTQTRIAEINAAADAAKADIEAKTDEQAARIPEVTALSSDVSSLKDDINIVKNNTDLPSVSGKVWTATDNGAEWADSQGGGVSAEFFNTHKSHTIIQGKAFNGFGKLADYDDAFLVLLDIPVDTAFICATKVNYPVAFGSEERYSTPQYMDSEYNRISDCVLSAGSITVGNTTQFTVITLRDVPENAAYIAIPYKSGTAYTVEYASLNYAEANAKYLKDGQLPYGIKLFDDGKNIVQHKFQGVSFVGSTKQFNYKSTSIFTQPVLYEAGKQVFHDGVANTLYFYAFDQSMGFISSALINSGGALPTIENAVYCMFNSVNEFTWIAYSNLVRNEYKPNKKIRNDLIDIDITQKTVQSVYNGMRASFIGDSLTQNGSGGDYINFLDDFFGFSQITNCGIGGTRISGESSVFGDPMWMDSRINALDIDSDIVFIMGGTNDAPSGAAYLGEITPENHDTSTFAGAYNVLLSKLYYKFGKADGMYDGIDYSGVTQAENAKDIRIIMITPPQRFPNRDRTENPWHYAENTNLYADAVVAIGKMHGIPVADIRSCAGINIFNRDRYICGPDVSNRNGSGVHLSADAHARWAEVIIGKMLETVETIDD